MPDILEQQWCCLDCSTVMPIGELVCKPTAPSARSLYCPKCKSFNVARADGAIQDVPEYFGEIPPRHQQS